MKPGENQVKGHREMTDHIQPVNAALATKILWTETLPLVKKRENPFNFLIMY